MRRPHGVGVAIVLSAALSGCGESGHARARGRIDEHRGSYAGVALGVTRAEVRRRLGRSTLRRAPADLSNGTGPWYLPSYRGPDEIYGDADISFLYGRVSSVEVYGRGTRTTAGVKLGDPLRQVSRLYRAACHSQRDLGEEGTQAPWCQVRSGRRVFLFFGGDPVQQMALSIVPFDGSQGG
jgi:hypothetical protein